MRTLTTLIISVALFLGFNNLITAAPPHHNGHNVQPHHVNPTPHPHQVNPNIHHNPSIHPNNHLHHTPLNKYFGPAYHLHHGFHSNFGWWYKGYSHPHWAWRYWNVTYGAWLYYDPNLYAYYYYCVPDRAWYPISYCPYGIYSWPDSPTEDNPDAIPPE